MNNPLNEDYLQKRVRKTGLNLGVKIGENYVDYSEGPIKETGNDLDLALSDKGFFAIEYTNKRDERTTMYTRDGNFTMDRQGFLKTQDGDYVLDDSDRRIRLDPAIPAGINRNGDIVQDGEVVATINVVDFEDYNYLERFGENLFRPVDGATRIEKDDMETDTQVLAGYLEMANISVVTEMVNMITLQRQYEANQKVITTYDETLEQAVNQNGKIG